MHAERGLVYSHIHDNGRIEETSWHRPLKFDWFLPQATPQVIYPTQTHVVTHACGKPTTTNQSLCSLLQKAIKRRRKHLKTAWPTHYTGAGRNTTHFIFSIPCIMIQFPSFVCTCWLQLQKFRRPAANSSSTGILKELILRSSTRGRNFPPFLGLCKQKCFISGFFGYMTSHTSHNITDSLQYHPPKYTSPRPITRHCVSDLAVG